MSLAEINNAVDALSPEELAELAAFIRERDNASWDQQIHRDFAEGGEPVVSRTCGDPGETGAPNSGAILFRIPRQKRD